MAWWRLLLSQGSRLPLAASVCAAAACMSHQHEEQGNFGSNLVHVLIPEVLGDMSNKLQGSNISARSTSTSSEGIASLQAWLAQQGADISRVTFKPSQVDSDAGLGVFLGGGQRPMTSRRRRWWLPFSRPPPYTVVAQFPLSSAITAANILNQPQVGPHYTWLLDKRVIDERQLVQCYLAVERARGEGSHLAPWIAALPQQFHTPLCWTDEQLSQLRGTTLQHATQELRARLVDTWRKLEPTLKEVATHLGAGRPVTLDDLVWAHCVFWSRGLSLPVPNTPGAASQLLAASNGTPPERLLTVHEAIVPGLDFVNHRSQRPTCWWEVYRQPPAEGQQGNAGHSADIQDEASILSQSQVRLQMHRGQVARGNDELTISYGDGKSNEELLLLYGFVEPYGTNPHDMVMVACPVPPAAQWDELMADRMSLLRSCGMRPQFFLHSSQITSSSQGSRNNPTPTTPNPHVSNSSSSSQEEVAPPPAEALEVLEVFALSAGEVAARQAAVLDHTLPAPGQHNNMETDLAPGLLSGAELDLDTVARTLKQRGGGPSDKQLAVLSTQLGLRMAALSTFIRLLEARVMDMEHDAHGTGSLENDERLLRQHAEAAARNSTEQQEGLLPYHTWCAVVYRAGQKRIVRAYLVGARREMQRVLALFEEVQDMQRGRQAAAETAPVAVQ